jgi:hypothetical protein
MALLLFSQESGSVQATERSLLTLTKISDGGLHRVVVLHCCDSRSTAKYSQPRRAI